MELDLQPDDDEIRGCNPTVKPTPGTFSWLRKQSERVVPHEIIETILPLRATSFHLERAHGNEYFRPQDGRKQLRPSLGYPTNLLRQPHPEEFPVTGGCDRVGRTGAGHGLVGAVYLICGHQGAGAPSQNQVVARARILQRTRRVRLAAAGQVVDAGLGFEERIGINSELIEPADELRVAGVASFSEP